MRTVFAAMAILLVALVALLFVEDGSSERAAPARVDVATIAARVEQLRGLRFRQRPEPVTVSAETARREGLEDLDRSYPEARRRADEEVLKLLGLIGPDVDLRKISASVFGEGVAGYYDPRTKRLRIVKGATPGPLAEIVIAHELTHALEDQHFGLALDPDATDDAALARQALVEGTATLVMQEYLLRYVGAEQALGALLGGLDAGPELPPFLQQQLLFPYTGGLQFASALKQRGGGTWKLVDLADRLRVPDSTEQVLHPEKWIEVEPPLPVRLRVDLGKQWHRTAAGTWGEWQSAQLAGSDAAGWGGDRYELWQRGTCTDAPCRDDDVLVMRWRWDTRVAAAKFAAALRARDDGAAIEHRGATVTYVLAPSRALANASA
ncbi:MAG TPA: hypothetical protein VFG79_15620 [Solirubrobacter sp.]|nr:hypothetical protein [Solirubrobacter sp.]